MKLMLPDLRPSQGTDMHVSGWCSLSPAAIAEEAGEHAPQVLRPGGDAEGLFFGLEYSRAATPHALTVFLRDSDHADQTYPLDVSVTTREPLLPSIVAPGKAGGTVYEPERFTQRSAGIVLAVMSSNLAPGTSTVCAHFEWRVSDYPTLQALFPPEPEQGEDVLGITAVTMRLPGGLTVSTGLHPGRWNEGYVHVSRSLSTDASLPDLSTLWSDLRDTAQAVLRQEVS